MTVWTSVFWKICYAIAEKWLERGVNRWFMSRKFDASPSIRNVVNISRELIIIFKLFSVHITECSWKWWDIRIWVRLQWEFDPIGTWLFCQIQFLWPSQVVIKSRPTLSLKDNFDSIGANWAVCKTVESMYISTCLNKRKRLKLILILNAVH